MNTPMIVQQKIVKFLTLAGCDLSDGFTSEDIKNYRLDYPELYKLIIDGQEPELPQEYETFKKCLNIQKKELEDWKNLLNEKSYQKLEQFVNCENEKLIYGDLPLRGESLTGFVLNINKKC